MKKIRSFIVLVLFFLSLFCYQIKPQTVIAASGTTQWAKSIVTGSLLSYFKGISVDSSGNIYAVGSVNGTGTYDFGNGVTVAGCNNDYNAVVVKYNSSGTAQWAKSVVSGPDFSYFLNISVDSADNIYAVGTIAGVGTFNFGDGVTVDGSSFFADSAVIVKYNSSGIAQWAKSAITPVISWFRGVSVDSSDNIYAVGSIWTNGIHDFGDGITVAGNSGGLGNVVIVKYNSSGTTQWAKSVSTNAGGSSQFNGVSVDSSDNIYAVGAIRNNGTFNFGNNVTVAGDCYDWDNTVLVKYNSSGTAQWAKSTVTASSYSYFNGVSVDSSGNIYAAGILWGNGTLNFGNNVTVAGNNSETNAVVVKYNSSGTAQWAKSTVVAPDVSFFLSVSVDSAGNIYAVGTINGTGTYDFGNSVTVAGDNAGDNAVMVKYNSSGIPQWAKSALAAPDASYFYSISVDSSGDIYAAGTITGTGTYDFGNGVTVAGDYAANTNDLIIKYTADPLTLTPDPDPTPDPTPTADPTFVPLPDDGKQINVDESQIITTNPYVLRVKPYSSIGISRVEFLVDDNTICISSTPDADGVYSCSWDTSKYHSIVKVYAYDATGNRSELLSRTTTVDPKLYLTVLPETGREK